MVIKKCSVVKNNDLVSVVKFDDIFVQLPSVGNGVKYVYVANEGSKYYLSSEKQYELLMRKAHSSKASKKEPLEQDIVEQECNDDIVICEEHVE